MEKSEVETSVAADEGSQLNRNRSFKSKQLVRSQAIRESTSPPRTISPSVRSDDSNPHVNAPTNNNTSQTSDSSHDGEVFSSGKQRVEIQITPDSWESEQQCMTRRSRRWGATPRDVLSNNSRFACVHCRGRRRRSKCPTKQDSGIVCSEDCPDCSDVEHNGSTNDIKKLASSNIETDEQYSCRCADRKDKPKSISLSRTDSDDKTEPMGPELIAFIKETLNKNARDRTTLLTIEKELQNFVNDPGRCIAKFPVMTSYGRMLVHRCASLFQLGHHLDQSNKGCVIVCKSGTNGGRIPCISFKSWCVASLPPSPVRHSADQHHAKSILKRDTHSLDEPSSGANAMSRSKSLEQREREYQRVRHRIFSSDETQWPGLNTGNPVKLLTPEPGRNKLLKVQSLENPSGPPVSWRGGAVVSKSHSFGGYGDQPQQRALSRQGDLASSSWRLSPSSSGYKTLSLRSTDSVTPSPTGGGTPEPATLATPAPSGAGGGALVWAVTDLAAVPRGAIVIHPQTGRALTNPDGSVYHFDPTNPPVLYEPGAHTEPERDKIDENSEKPRGRLEKQHSFLDNENSCHSTEESCNTCSCEYKKEQAPQQQQQQQTESPTQPVENTMEKEISKPPPSPVKPYEANAIQNNTIESTNHSKPSVTPTNHKTPETHQPDSASQRHEMQTRSLELANQREAVKMMSQDMVHYNQVYAQPYHGEEMTSQINPYLQQDMSLAIQQGKVASAMHDPNMRQISMSSMLYPTAIPQAYPAYIHNHRMDQLGQQMYQPMLQQMEEPKQISTPPQQQDNGFRIDPSYPFPAVDYACYDPAQLQHHAPAQRSYSVPYNQVEVPAMSALMPPAYPTPNILLPPSMQQYPVHYQEPVQWSQVQSPVAPKLYDVCPVLYPHYTQYNLLYPQVVPQAYPVWQGAALVRPPEPAPYHHRKRNSLPHTPRTSHTPQDRKTHDEKEFNRQDSNEIAVKIQQIKEQMAGLKTRGGVEARGGPGVGRRNSGGGILPTPLTHCAHHPHDDIQLSTAARDIINSLRNIQAKNTYQQDRRFEGHAYNRSFERNDSSYRNRRYDRDADKPGDRSQGSNSTESPDVSGKGDGDRRFEPRNRVNQVNLPFRPPYLFRQMSPGTWCRRSPAPVHPSMNHPRRPHPDSRPRR